VRRFLLERWPGRLLLGALALSLVGLVGVPLPDVVAHGAGLVVFAFVLWAMAAAFVWLLRILMWRIRTKLIVSYLFIAVVPLCLLALFFFIGAMLTSGVVGSYLVEADVARQAALLDAAAREVLADANPDSPPKAAKVRARLAAIKEIHPQVGFALVAGGQVVAAEGSAPAELPRWFRAPSWSGLARGEKSDVVRAIRGDAGLFVALEVPVDKEFFAALEARTGLRIMTTGGLVESDESGSGVQVRRRGRDDVTLIQEPVDGLFPFVAPVPRTNWTTGVAMADPITFQYSPLELFRKLAPQFGNIGGILQQVSVIVGVAFLVMYGFALIIGWMLARTITLGVHELTRGTERLRAGDFRQPVRFSSRDQLGDLATSFNMMAAGIEDLLLQNAEKERLEEELRIARQIQMSLLPQGVVEMSGLRIAALCLPATEVGGDYYDLLPLSESRMGVLVADVSGKGTSAALYMAELKGLVLSLSRIYESPARLLGEANRILCSTLDPRSFITMTYAMVDTRARTVRLARAGHNPVIVFEQATGKTRVVAPPGLGLGLDKGEVFERVLEEVELPLHEGDIFLFFTDGLSEAMNPASELFGEIRLAEILAEAPHLSSEELKERILAEIRHFVDGAAQHDDMTLVILKVVAP
jgi:serine phosphatase RsbU (regulator of sigma subunit)